jgi:hypothetical protein
MLEISNNQLDAALRHALTMLKSETEAQRFNRVLTVANLVSEYYDREAFFPPMNSIESETFHACCDEALALGILK